MAVTAGSAELTLLFVFDVFVLLARACRAVTVRTGIAVATFTHSSVTQVVKADLFLLHKVLIVQQLLNLGE